MNAEGYAVQCDGNYGAVVSNSWKQLDPKAQQLAVSLGLRMCDNQEQGLRTSN